MATDLSPRELAALDLARRFPTRSLTSGFASAQLGDGFDTRRWAGILGSLANRGLLVQHKDAFVGRTFWTLPENKEAS